MASDHGLVHHLFARQAARTPDAVALVCGDTSTTYRELDERADRLAAHLEENGVRPGDIVGVVVDRGPEMVVAILAILKASAAYAMLDPEYPVARLNELIEESRLGVLVTRTAAEAVRHESAIRCVALADLPVDGPVLPPRVQGGPAGAPACVMFTSGSSGRPKAVVTSHRALLATLVGQDLALTSSAVWLQWSPVSWDAFALELWGALLFGGKCVLYQGNRPDPAVLAGLVRQHGVTNLYLSASLFHLVVDEYPEMFDGLRRLTVGGEAMSPVHAGKALHRKPDLALYNGYGPVEATVFVTQHEVAAQDTTGRFVSLGQPLTAKRLYLLDEELRPTPDGEVGEVYAAGEGLADGYLGRPGYTAERFVADPFGAGGERMYRVGDLARRHPDGRLEFVGRADHQVKIRGFRVDPAEIEGVLLDLPQVVRATVVVREDRPGDRRLVAYVVSDVDEPGRSTAVELLREQTQTRLPDFAVPSAFVVLDAFPLTPNGKLDRSALPAPEGPVVGSRLPRTEHETLLCELFATVLGLPEVGVDDDFFALGGHSLLLAKLVSRLNRCFGVNLTARAVFEAPTVAALAALVAAGDGWEELSPGPVPVERPDRMPLSFAQSGFTFLDSAGAGSAYHTPVLLRLTGVVDHTALVEALSDVVERHEALRTVFPVVGGERVQQVLSEHASRLDFESVTVRSEALDALVSEFVERAFDLRADLPLRAMLCTVAESPARHVLLLVVHHIAIDGWSLRPLLGDLGHAYAARLRRREPGWRPLPLQYADFTLWQRGVLGAPGRPSGLLARRCEHWRQVLRDLPVRIPLPARPDPPADDDRAGVEERRLTPEEHGRLLALARDHRCTLFMVLQAALSIVLNRFGAGTDIPVGTVVAGRGEEQLDDLVGCFVNTLVLRADLSGDPTVATVLERIREVDLSAYDRDVPFAQLVDAVNPERLPGVHPLVQVMLVLQNNAPATVDLLGLSAAPVELPQPARARFDLTVQFTPAPDGSPEALDLMVAYRAAVLDREVAAAMTDALVLVLRTMPDAVEARTSELELLTTAGLDAARRTMTGAVTAIPDRQVGEIVAAQAESTPDALAVRCGEVTLSYAELLRRARRLAGRIQLATADREPVVGVCLPRSADQVVALLAVNLAGAVYLPLDPEYPSDRIRHVLEDSGARLVLTTAGTAEVPAGADVRVRTMRVDEPEPADDVPPALSPRRSDLAYLMYTSGSTGRPKGVSVSHRSLTNLVLGQRATLGVTPDDRVLQYSSVGFDASIWETYLALAAGAAVHVARSHERLGAALLGLLRDAGITVATLVPSVVSTLPADAPNLLPHLRTLVVAGEACPPVLSRSWASGRRFVNAYGPTEATVCGTLGVLEPHDPPLIGRALPNVAAYVLDDRLRPVPPGVPGEIYLGGAAVARGYHRQPALTAGRFVADPHSREPGARMYRTGDLGRVLRGGDLEYLGRADGQLKIGGVRIEPAEVEAVLVRHESVSQAAVTTRPDRSGDPRLVAYVVPSSPGSGDSAQLRRYLSASLPAAMVPDTCVFLSALPLTVNGKLDRAALPQPELRGPRAAESTPPRTALERRLAGVWSEVLDVDGIGVHDDFFALGGNSLRAVRVCAALEETETVPVTVADLLRAPSVAALAALLEQRAGSGVTATRPVIPVLPRRAGAGATRMETC